MKINLETIKKINWKNFLKQNKYSLVSLLICLIYFYAAFSAVIFIVKQIRLAFSADRDSANSRVIMFDTQSYDKISKRFNNQK